MKMNFCLESMCIEVISKKISIYAYNALVSPLAKPYQFSRLLFLIKFGALLIRHLAISWKNYQNELLEQSSIVKPNMVTYLPTYHKSYNNSRFFGGGGEGV